MRIWLVSMECAGISEAGGVKDVAYALCKGFAGLDNDVTLFIPAFGCTSYKNITDLKEDFIKNVAIDLCCKDEIISYSSGKIAGTGAKVVFINHPSFANKLGVYVYTEAEERANPAHVKATGHDDMLFLDALFSKAVAEYVRHVENSETPDIIHCHDASTSVLPCYVKTLQAQGFFDKTKCVVTIHNAGPAYHHDFSDVDQARWYTGFDKYFLETCKNGNRVEPYLLGATNASLTTVSTFYAEELVSLENDAMTDGLSLAFYDRGIKIEGITNGIDYDSYCPLDPEISLLPYAMNPREGDFEGKQKNRNYMLKLCEKDFCDEDPYTKGIKRFGFIEPAENRPVYFVYHGRIVWQKGLPVLLDALDSILKMMPGARFIIGGQGSPEIENQLERIAELHAGKVVFFKGYNSGLSRLIAASGDFIILPSLFEPCGLEDFIAQIYGTLPIAHATGGLKKIIDGETGYLYNDNSVESLIDAVLRATAAFYRGEEYHSGIVKWTAEFIHNVYSWDFVIESKYLKFFKKSLLST